MASKEDFKMAMNKFHPELSPDEIEKKYIDYCEYEKRSEEFSKKSRHIASGTETITYKPWTEFDVVQAWAKNSPHPLKSVSVGYMFKGDVPCDSKDIETSSVSSQISHEASLKGGIPLTIISLNEAISRVKKIDWSKINIER